MAPPSSSWRSTRSARPTRSERKVEICERAYKLLTADGFPPEDIIFDPNIFAIATGIDEHRRYAIDFIEAAREIRAPLPRRPHLGRPVEPQLLVPRQRAGAPRDAQRVPLPRHPRRAWTWRIVNAGQLDVYDEIDPELREACEDVILDRARRCRPSG